MADRREYRSSQRSRRMIREAFLELLEEKEFSKITVTDITNRADLNRSTFYAHYPDVKGVVEEIQDEIIEKNMRLMQEMTCKSVLKDPMPYLDSLCKTLEDYIVLFKKLGYTGDIHPHLERYRSLLAENILADTDIPESIRSASFIQIHIQFFVGGILNTYEQWIEGKLDRSLSEISLEIAGLIKKAASDYVDAPWMN